MKPAPITTTAATARRDLGTQTDRVVERAEFVNVIEGVLVGEAARVGAGSDHEAVEAED